MRLTRSMAGIVCAAVLGSPAAHAQSLSDRLLAAPDGSLRMSYPARPDLCGDRTGVYWSGVRSDENWQRACTPGPARVQLEKTGGEITRIRTYLGGAWRAGASVTDFGVVDAREASEYLLDLADAARASVAEDALAAAVMADAPDPWQRLLELARERPRNAEVREKAVFWLGQSAASEATRGLAEIVDTDAESVKLQKAAVFALSQRDDAERIDQVMRVARTHSNPEVVKTAFFWLADSEDQRVLNLFVEILSAQPSGAGGDGRGGRRRR